MEPWGVHRISCETAFSIQTGYAAEKFLLGRDKKCLVVGSVKATPYGLAHRGYVRNSQKWSSLYLGMTTTLGCVWDAYNFSRLGMYPAKFTYLDRPASFLRL